MPILLSRADDPLGDDLEAVGAEFLLLLLLGSRRVSALSRNSCLPAPTR
jgi:hypothetical protein